MKSTKHRYIFDWNYLQILNFRNKNKKKQQTNKIIEHEIHLTRQLRASIQFIKTTIYINILNE